VDEGQVNYVENDYIKGRNFPSEKFYEKVGIQGGYYNMDHI
jgi:hypothetical protein